MTPTPSLDFQGHRWEDERGVMMRSIQLRTLLALFVLAALGCNALGNGARDEFSRSFTCPADRVEVKRRSDLHASSWGGASASAPPPEVAADPERLAMWQKQEADRAARNDYGAYFEVSGCEHQVLYRCANTTRGSTNPVSCSERAYPSASSRWIWVAGNFLAFLYVDPQAGVSGKGAFVSDPPTEAELQSVTTAPKETFRDPVRMGARALSVHEVDALKLPSKPAWLTLEAAGSPALPSQYGRFPPTPDPSSLSVVNLQIACGPLAGGAWSVEPNDTFLLGSAPVELGSKGAQLSGPDVLPRHAMITKGYESAMLYPEPSAHVTLNGGTINGPEPLDVNARIGIGTYTLIVRPGAWRATKAGPDPSCPPQ